MLKLLKRWLGWDADSTLFDFSELRQRQSPTLTSQRQTPVAPTPARPDPPRQGTAAAGQRREKRKARDPIDLLDNPRLTLDKPADDGFDPYNTGAFNRSSSWERIGRQKKR